MELESQREGEIVIHADDSWELINGEYDDQGKNWRYHATDLSVGLLECNIMLLKKASYSFIESENVKICGPISRSYALQNRLEDYHTIFEHYLHPYEVDKIGKMTVVFVPESQEWRGDGYIRDHLIISSTSPENQNFVRHLLAHEMGHAYATGANIFLGRTSLMKLMRNEELYFILRKDAKKIFIIELICLKKGQRGKNFFLNPFMEKRPNDVHDIGTMIYYEIFSEKGRSAIETLLQTFNSIDQKTTEVFFSQLRKQQNCDLADKIDCHILRY